MCLSSVIGSAAACSMASMVSCNLVTTLTLGLAARLANSDVIMLPRTSFSHLQSYLLPARFILNFYISCGCCWTCRRSSTSISLGSNFDPLSSEDIWNKRFNWSQASTFSYNRNAIGLAIACASAIRTHSSVHGTAHPMSAASVAVVTTCLRKVKHRITAPLRVPQLVVPPLTLTVSTRKPMYARMPPS